MKPTPTPQPDQPCRCGWVDLSKPDYIAYHDNEWGQPVHDDRVLFEFIVLESAQAGLSWYTILRKRENYRRAFDGFVRTLSRNTITLKSPACCKTQASCATG